MNRKKLIFVLIACIAVILVFSAILIISNRYKISSGFASEIESADLDINSGFYRQAADRLAEAYRFIGNSSDAMIFLKRMDRLASLTGNYADYAGYSEKLLSDYSRNIEIAAIAAYAQQKNSNYKKALIISEQKLSNTDYSSIYLLSLLKNDRLPEDLKKRSRFDEKYGFLFTGQAYTADLLLQASEKISDQRLVADAALLLMKDGRKKEAYNEIKKTDTALFPALKSLIAYDNEDYASAVQYFKGKLASGDADSELFGIDLLLRNGKKAQAANACMEYIKNTPSGSPVPYRNLYALNSENPGRIDWIDKGLGYFPENEDLLVAAAWEYYLNNDTNMLNQMLESISSKGNNVAAGLFKVNMMLDNRNPEHVAGNFWVVFNLDPTSEITAVSFANYLLENKQFDQLDTLIKRYAEVNGEQDWTAEYSAIAHALKGEYEAAETGFHSAVEMESSAMNLYNLGELQLLKKNYRKASDNLEKALISAESGHVPANYTAKMYLKLSETNYNIREFKRAEYYINRAIELNPGDTRSRLMLAKIKEEYND